MLGPFEACYHGSLQVKSSKPPEMGTIHVTCPVQKAVAIGITLTNPLDSPVTLRATYSLPELVGPARFNVAAGAESTFECYFAPLLLGKSQGEVTLVNEKVRIH